MAVDAEGNGTLTRRQAEIAVQKARQKLRRAKIEEEKQQAEWDKMETQMENIKVRVGEAALDHDKAFSAYHDAVARQAEVNNRTAFSTIPKPAAADVSTAALPAELYASLSPELGQAATEANAKIASLKLEIQTVIEAVQAQGREIEAQKAAAQQTSAPLPGEQTGPGVQGPGSDDGNATSPTRTGNSVRRNRRCRPVGFSRTNEEIEYARVLPCASLQDLVDRVHFQPCEEIGQVSDLWGRQLRPYTVGVGVEPCLVLSSLSHL